MSINPVPKGPDRFEELLANCGLSERESDAVRSVVLGFTAAKTAPLMGVSASTVGSYRLRAYQKLGVTTKGEFLALPEVGEWLATRMPNDCPAASELQASAGGSQRVRGMYIKLFLKCLLASFTIVVLSILALIYVRALL